MHAMKRNEAMVGDSDLDEKKESTLLSIGVVLALAVGFFLWGFFIFFAVGDKGPPSWSFGVVEDIPGESSFSTHSHKQFPSIHPQPAQSNLLERQHIVGPAKEPDKSQERGNK